MSFVALEGKHGVSVMHKVFGQMRAESGEFRRDQCLPLWKQGRINRKELSGRNCEGIVCLYLDLAIFCLRVSFFLPSELHTNRIGKVVFRWAFPTPTPLSRSGALPPSPPPLSHRIPTLCLLLTLELQFRPFLNIALILMSVTMRESYI